VGRYRARDLVLVPNLISLVRVPLAALFVGVAHRPLIALAVLALAGISDMLDGWYARRFRKATATGAVVDPITDKLFVTVVVITLWLDGRLPLWGVILLAARELGELPLVAWWTVSRPRRRARAEHPKANVPGKAATTLQFAAVSAALFASSATAALLVAAGIAGALAAASYWWRELAAARGSHSVLSK